MFVVVFLVLALVVVCIMFILLSHDMPYVLVRYFNICYSFAAQKKVIDEHIDCCYKKFLIYRKSVYQSIEIREKMLKCEFINVHIK
jgi:hypothetical protein